MAYIDGFVIPVQISNKENFIETANIVDQMFMDLGAVRILECWADDLQVGEVTDFRKAVKAKDDETVVFSWVEWPDKQTREEAKIKFQKMVEEENRPAEEQTPPFDGRRLIYGGFMPVVEL